MVNAIGALRANTGRHRCFPRLRSTRTGLRTRRGADGRLVPAFLCSCIEGATQAPSRPRPTLTSNARTMRIGSTHSHWIDAAWMRRGAPELGRALRRRPGRPRRRSRALRAERLRSSTMTRLARGAGAASSWRPARGNSRRAPPSGLSLSSRGPGRPIGVNQLVRSRSGHEARPHPKTHRPPT